jgi:hypothetical protein
MGAIDFGHGPDKAGAALGFDNVGQQGRGGSKHRAGGEEGAVKTHRTDKIAVPPGAESMTGCLFT